MKEKGASLHVQEVKDPNEEAEYIAGEIEKRCGEGVPAEEIAVLFPDTYGCQAGGGTVDGMQSSVSDEGTSPNIYDHFIAKDIQAYFRLALGERRPPGFSSDHEPSETLYRKGQPVRENAFF